MEGPNEWWLEAFAMTTMQWLYRVWRNQLHNTYKKFETNEERLENLLKEVNIDDWKHLINYFSDEKFQVLQLHSHYYLFKFILRLKKLNNLFS